VAGLIVAGIRAMPGRTAPGPWSSIWPSKRFLLPMDNPSPLISVGVLSYKRPHLLCHALDSIARQTYQNLEVIISDNGSDDPGIREVVAKFTKSHPGTRAFFHKTNRGALWNFRFALEQATGSLFIWLADDDFWSADFLEKLLAARKPDRPSLVYSACVPISLDTNETGTPVKERRSEKRGLRNVFRQTLFDTDSVIYGLFDRAVGARYAPLLRAWPVPAYCRKRFPTVEVDFVSYAFLYGLMLEADFFNVSRIGGMHFMMSTPRSATKRTSPRLVERLLDASSVVVNMSYIHILLSGRFLRAAILARSLTGIVFATIAAGYLFLRRLAKAALHRLPFSGRSGQ